MRRSARAAMDEPAADDADSLETPSAEWRRAARLWAVVVLFVAVGVARSMQVGIPFRDPNGAYLLSRVGLTLAIFVVLVLVDGVARCPAGRSPGRVWATIRSRWTPRRL